MNTVLEVNNLTKKYKNFYALNKVNMHIYPKEIYGLIGKNGSGKTTLIRLICGLQKPTSGNYYLFGISNSDKEILTQRHRMSAVVESSALVMSMTAKENLIHQYKIIGLPSLNGIDELLNSVGLNSNDKKLVKNYSLGMKQRLAIALSLASNPDFLILDEPINGLDPEGIIELRELILNINKERNITILISSHYLDELSKIATNYGFLNNGCIIEEISAKELNKKIKKKIELKINNIKLCIPYLEKEHITYEIIDNEHIYLYGKIDISKIILDLKELNCTVLEIHERNETLENYYINLMGCESDE